jgi:hypothetical protein
VEEVRQVLGGGVQVIGLCDLDSLGEERERQAIAQLLAEATTARSTDGSATDAASSAVTVVASCAPDADVSYIVASAPRCDVTIGGPPATARPGPAQVGVGS